jgi:hypothetical protein
MDHHGIQIYLAASNTTSKQCMENIDMVHSAHHNQEVTYLKTVPRRLAPRPSQSSTVEIPHQPTANKHRLIPQVWPQHTINNKTKIHQNGAEVQFLVSRSHQSNSERTT